MSARIQRARYDLLTLHHILLDHLTELLHVGLGQVLAVLGRLEPLVRARIALEFGWSRLRDLSIWHGEEDLGKESEASERRRREGGGVGSCALGGTRAPQRQAHDKLHTSPLDYSLLTQQQS